MDDISDIVERGDPIGRRYGAVAGREWRHLLSHMALADGFLFCVLVVPDQDGAALCKEALLQALARDGRSLGVFEPETPAQLRALAGTLLESSPTAPSRGVWLAAVVAEAAPHAAVWKQAWQALLEGLNQQRNPLRREIDGPLVLVGAGWLVPMLREVAPDLWSVRSLVTRIEPAPGAPTAPDTQKPRELERRADTATDTAPDPDLALREAAKLADRPGQEANRASLLGRAAVGLRARGDLPGAERLLREALSFVASTGHQVLEGRLLHELARAARDQGRAAEAEALFRQALALQEAGGGTDISRGITMSELGRTVFDQGRAAEAEALFRQALALKDAGSGTDISRGITMDLLGRAVRDQGRAAEAEALFRQSLALAEAGGDTDISRSITMDSLGRVVRDQGRAAEAEALFRQALALAESGGDTDGSRGITMTNLSAAVRDQGRAAEAAEILKAAAALMGERG